MRERDIQREIEERDGGRHTHTQIGGGRETYRERLKKETEGDTHTQRLGKEMKVERERTGVEKGRGRVEDGGGGGGMHCAKIQSMYSHAI